jgi:hypothetical protein
MNCDYCLDHFENEEYLNKHLIQSKNCSKYKDILFVCKKCKFSTVGIKNIDKHIKNTCTKEDDGASYELISDDDDNIQIKILNRIEKKIDSLIKSSSNNINKINKNISEMPIHFILPPDNTEEKTLKKKNKDVNTFKKNLPEIDNIENTTVIIDEYSKILEDISTFNDNNSQKSSPSLPYYKKNAYKSLKNQVELVSELPKDEIKSIINSKKEQIEDKKNNYLEIIKNSENIFKECFEGIKQSRNYSKSLALIKKTRLNLIECMPYEKYIKLLQNHIKILENIFKNLREFPNKKIIETVSKSMNTIDMRLMSYGSYINTVLEMDDIHRYKSSLKFFNLSQPCFVPLNKEELFKTFFNYGTALFTLKDMIEMFLPNFYGFHNIIYVKLKNSTDDDPFSFYILEDMNTTKKVEKKYWKMDCRLEEFSNNFIDNIKPYLIENFRKLYYNCFNDNEFRKDYITTNTVTEYDCEQLLQNIHLLSKPKEFNILLRNIIKLHCTYQPTVNDRFNLYGDDIVQKKKFSNLKEEEEIMIDTVKILFDNITSADAVDFYRTI